MFSLFLSAAQAKHWAVIMAGSRGFRNYRHQSDVYQMYKILIDRGFDKDRVILMSYDDVADLHDNPFPGKIFNIRKHINVRPPKEEIDYIGEEVTANNLYAVLTGDKNAANGKPVLESTEQDDVFFYYNDHGMSGFLCVPSGDNIAAPDLRRAVETMKQKKMFRRFFICIEACYSGSVAKHLRGIDGVAVVTAANAIQSSYSHGYDDNIDTFRTNEWTNNLMYFILAHPNSTVGRLFNYTKMLTYGSDVRFYGDKSLFGYKIKEFLGDSAPLRINFENAEIYENHGRVDQMKAEMTLLQERIRRARSDEERAKLIAEKEEEKERRRVTKGVFDDIVMPLSGQNAKQLGLVHKTPQTDKQWKCYKSAVKAFAEKCGNLTEYSMRRVSVFSTLCKFNEESEVVDRISTICKAKKW